MLSFFISKSSFFPPLYNISPAFNGTFLTFSEVNSLLKAMIRDSCFHPDSMNWLSKKYRQSILSTLRTVQAYSPVSIVVWWRPPWEERARLCSSLCLCLNKNWKPVSSFKAICSGFLSLWDDPYCPFSLFELTNMHHSRVSSRIYLHFKSENDLNESLFWLLFLGASILAPLVSRRLHSTGGRLSKEISGYEIRNLPLILASRRV